MTEKQSEQKADVYTFAAEGHTNWSFTLGSKTEDIHELDPNEYVTHLKDHGVAMGRLGIESGTRTGYHHWQCAVEFTAPHTFDMVRRALEWRGFVPGKLKFHAPSTKKWWNAFSYCAKTGKHVTFNEKVQERMSAGDTAIAVNNMILSGVSLLDINKAHPVYVMNNLDKLMKYQGWLSGKYKRCRFDLEPEDR